MKVPLIIRPIILKPLTALIQKRAAGYTASYLNKRRQVRLAHDKTLEVTETIAPERLEKLCQPEKEVKLAGILARSPWPMLLSGTLGAGLGAILCFIFMHRK